MNPHKKVKKLPTYEKGVVPHVKINQKEKKNEEKHILNKLKNKTGGLKKSKKSLKMKELKKHAKIALKLNPVKNGKKEIAGDGSDDDDKKDRDLKMKIDKETFKSQFNKEGKIVFSKIEIPHSGSKFDRPNKKKANKFDKIEKNPLKLIKNLKAQKEEIKELVASGEAEKASELEKIRAWKKAFEKTEGKKIRDDPTLIMKDVKLKRAEKKKSKNQWQERKNKIKMEEDKKIKKRNQNIESRNKAKTTRKMKTLTKRGRIIPGF